MGKRLTPEELWAMPTADFNQWRAENDLPQLFAHFQKVLPQFDAWLTEFGFSLEFIVQLRNPGQLFHGDGIKLLLESNEAEHIDQKYFFVDPRNGRAKKASLKSAKKYGNKVIQFQPYLSWAQKELKKQKFIPAGISGELETLRYTTGTAPDVPEMCSWSLVGFPVLKLGAQTIPNRAWLSGMNLDFTNLDFLVVEGKNHGNSRLPVFYSHIHNVKILSGELNFIEFYACDIAKFQLTDSSLYSSLFVDGNIWGLLCKNSKIRNAVFHQVSISELDLDNSSLSEIVYVPPSKEFHQGKVGTFEDVKEVYKRLRVAYSKTGDRIEAKSSFFNERLYGMKYHWGCIRPGDFIKALWKCRWKMAWHDLWSSFKYAFLFFSDFASYLLWGFGEKPRQIIVNAVLLIIGYSGIFHLLNIPHNSGYVDSLYMSVFTFTRLGLADATSFSNLEKLLIGSEGLMGWVMIVLVISGYASKAKY